MPLSTKPQGPNGPAHPHTNPSGTLSAREPVAYYADIGGDTPGEQPTEPSMPLRPRLAPGTPVRAMTVPTDPNGAGKHPFVVILSKQQAIDIYMMRSPETTTEEFKDVAGKSSMVAEMYRVSPKTIRDIWNRKTWTQVTRESWTAEEAEEHAQEQALAKLPPSERAALKDDLKKRRGRPPGSKDTRPRRRRIKAGDKGDASEGVMYVTTEEGAVEVRPIPAAPSTSDSVIRMSRSASPVRRAPPFNPKRASCLRALHEFETGKTSADAKAHSRGQPSASHRFNASRSSSFDSADFTPPQPHHTSAVPMTNPGTGLSEDHCSPRYGNSRSSASWEKPGTAACASWEEPGTACDDEPECEPDETTTSPVASETVNEEDPDFQQQNILGPVDDQLDLYVASPSVAKAAPAPLPAASIWAQRAEESHGGLSIEQELERRRQRHQAHFAESRSMLSWIAQHHSNPFDAFSRSLSTPAPQAVQMGDRPASPIVSSLAAAPPADPFAVPEAPPQGGASGDGEDGHDAPLLSRSGCSGLSSQLLMSSHGCDSHHGLWFPGHSQAEAQHSNSQGPPCPEWHAPFYGLSRETSRDVATLDKQLALPSAGSSPCITHVPMLSRSGMSGLGSTLPSVSEDGWWGCPPADALGSQSWRSDVEGGLRPL